MNESDVTFQTLTRRYHNYCLVKANAHYHVSERLRYYHKLLGIAATALTAGVGSAVFASLAKSGDTTSIKIVTGIISVAAVIATALQSFLALATEAERHRSVAGKYGVIRRSIELVLLKYPTAQGKPDDVATIELEKIKKEMDEVTKDAPSIPDKDYDAVTERRKTLGSTALGPGNPSQSTVG